MDLLNNFYIGITKWLSSHAEWIATAFITTLLVIYGNDINRLVRRWVSGWPFIFRIAAFIALCALGYGLAITQLSPMLENFLESLNEYLTPIVAIMFIAVGMVAERRNQL